MIKVVLESPLNGPTRDIIERNKRYARRAMLDSIQHNEAPFASHLLYDQEGILDELIIDDRNTGIAMGLLWGESASLIIVYTDYGISDGMRLGIEHYQKRGIPIQLRSIGRLKGE